MRHNMIKYSLINYVHNINKTVLNYFEFFIK
jgi:hypothetical protein